MSQPAYVDARRVLGRFRPLLVQVAAALTAAAEACLHPVLVLPLVLVTANLSWTALGVVAAVAVTGWALAQLVADPTGWGALPANWRSWFTAIRALLAVGLAVTLAGLAVPTAPSNNLLWLLAGFWIVGGLVAAGGPGGVLSGGDEAAGAGGEQYDFWGGVALVLVGLMLAQWLGPEGIPFPGWVVVLTGLAALALWLATLLLWPAPRRVATDNALILPHLAVVPTLLAHGRRLRRYTFFRVLLAASSLADPLYIIFALRILDLPWQSAGTFIALFALVRVGAGLAYPGLTAAGYARLLVQVAALTRVLIPLLMVTLPLILRSVLVNRTEASSLGPLVFGGIVVLWGLAVAGADAADRAYLRDALAPMHRPATRGLFLMLLVVLSFAYVAGGVIVDRWGFEALMLVAFGAGLLTLFASGLLLGVPPAETRDMTVSGALPTFRDTGEW